MATLGGTVTDTLRTPRGKIVGGLVAGTAVLSLAIAGIGRGMNDEEAPGAQGYEPADTTSEITESSTYGFQDPEDPETSSSAPQSPSEGVTSPSETSETDAPSQSEEPSPTTSAEETSEAPQPTPPLAFEGKQNQEGDSYNCWVTENDTAKIFTNGGRAPEGFKLALFTIEKVDGQFQPYIYFPEDNGLVWLNEDVERSTSTTILVESGVDEGVNVGYPQLDDLYNQYLQDNEDIFEQLYGSFREESVSFYSNPAGDCPPKEEFN